MHSSHIAEAAHLGGERIERMRYSQFRVAAWALALAIASSVLTSKLIRTQLSEVLVIVCLIFLLPCFVLPAMPQRAFKMLRARPSLTLVWVAAISLARFCFTSPNTLYIPAVVIAFVLVSTGTMRHVRAAAAIEFAGGLALIAVVRTVGQVDEGYDKLVVTYGLCGALATYFVGLVILEFPSCLERVEKLLSSARKQESPPLITTVLRHRPGAAPQALVAGLDVTPGQALVVEALIEGGTNDEIAERLGISVRTVQGHIRGALSRTGLSGRTQLAVAAALVVNEP